jgi:50S ribosomal protein L16 3-hydroxylase
LRLPDALSPERFLSDYWQKRPLFMPAALDMIQPSLEPDELAWLATQEDVECRLVFTEHDGGVTSYEVEDGPFDDDFLGSLPGRNWTLLVQDVEKHLPEFRAHFTAIDFVPDWRIDDLMVSFAAPGGGVGPHRDNYDVFLCQDAGQREWRLGHGDDVIPDESSGDLSLLQPFEDERPLTATSGDVLYLPPGVPHWGIARDFCMTWSIGMRAPTLAELNAGIARILHEGDVQSADVSPTDSEVFYEDPDLAIDEAQAGLISDAAVRRTKQILHSDVPLDEGVIAMVLGCVATGTKAWLTPEKVSDEEASQLIETIDRNSKLLVHGMARIAFSHAGGLDQIFANGHAKEVSPAQLGLFREICRDRRVTFADICDGDEPGLLHWLLAHGVVDLTECSL